MTGRYASQQASRGADAEASVLVWDSPPQRDDSSQLQEGTNRLLTAGIALAVAVVTVQTVCHLANAFLFDGRFEPLDAGYEGNAFTWASSVAVFAGALMVFMCAVLFRERRRSFLVLAAILAFLSLDDVVQVHETLGWNFAMELGLPRYMGGRMFLVLYLPLLALTFALLWRTSRDVPGGARRVITLGLILLVLAIVGEGLGAVMQAATDGTFHDAPGGELEVAFEEAAEVGGWILIATGLAVGFYARLIRSAA